MFRPLPPRIKRYEALGSITDWRTKQENWQYRVYSSSGNKYYTVEYNDESNRIMTNDNATFYKWYLGYPALCYLLECWILEYQENLAILVKWIYRKKLNTDMNYNFEAVITHLEKTLPWDWKSFSSYVDKLQRSLKQLKLQPLWEKRLPPEGW